MSVDPTQAAEKGLSAEHNGQSYYFCGKGCMLDFRDNPEQFLAPDYQPSM